MKYVILILLVLTISFESYGQGVLGFFTQQDTKKKDMAEQIVLLNTYLGEVKTGYSDAKKGLTTIHDLKNESFDLNASYFNSLSQVNPAISGNPKVKEIISLAEKIMGEFGSAISWEQQQNILDPESISYLKSVQHKIQSGCSDDLSDLRVLITPGRLQLKDEERIQRIDKIDVAMKDKYAFTGAFISNARSVTISKLDQVRQDKLIRQLYNLK